MNSKKARKLRSDAKKFSNDIGKPELWDKIYEQLKKSTKGLEVGKTN